MDKHYFNSIKELISLKKFEPDKKVLETEGILAFQDKKMMKCARNYLKKYEAEQVKQLITGKTYLIFNKEIDRPFIKPYQVEDTLLIELIAYLENTFNKKLDQIDRAFLEWEVYEECNRRIVDKVLRKVFKVELSPIERYLVIKRLKMRIMQEENLSVQELKRVFDKINQKRLVFYKYTYLN